MSKQQVWLGLAGDLVSPDAAPDHYSTRIGGCPVFPGPKPEWVCPRCQVCGAALSLVLQAYTPLPQLPDRVLLLFGCTKAGCGKQPGCWRALRCQLPAAQPATQQQQQQADSASSSSQHPHSTNQAQPAAGFDAVAAAGDWGFGDAASGGLGGWDVGQQATGPSNSNNAFDFSDLTTSLSAVVQQQQQQQQKQQQQQQQTKQHQRQQQVQLAAASEGAGEGIVASSKGTAGPQLPEFYLYSTLEPDASSSKAIPSKELQHVQELLAAYEANEALSTTAAAGGPNSGSSSSRPAAAAAAAGSSAAAAAAASAAAGAAGDDAGASWAGEEYEPDAVGCMQHSYLKFMKRLGRQPQQCARYSHNGPLLWPKVPLPQPSPCAGCGSPRVFELQLMPAVSHLVLEAAEMMQEQLGQAPDAAVVNAVANWDLCSVAVFTCQASCHGGSSGGAQEPGDPQQQLVVLQEEEVVVVFEAEGEQAAERSYKNGDGDSDQDV